MKRTAPAAEPHKSSGRPGLIISIFALLVSVVAVLIAYLTSPLSGFLAPKLEYTVTYETLHSNNSPDLISGLNATLKIKNVSRVSAHEISAEFAHDADSEVTFAAEGALMHEVLQSTPGRQIIRIQTFPPGAEFVLHADVIFKEPVTSSDMEMLNYFNGFGRVFHQAGSAVLVKRL